MIFIIRQLIYDYQGQEKFQRLDIQCIIKQFIFKDEQATQVFYRTYTYPVAVCQHQR